MEGSKSERFELRLDAEILKRIDDWRVEESDLPSRSEAVRRLVNKGVGSSADLQQYQIMRFQILSSALNAGKKGPFDSSYIYAWAWNVYPFYHSADYHRPFENQFKVPPMRVEELAKFLEQRQDEGKLPSFYELEDNYSVRSGRGFWDRSSLIMVCRYLYLRETFDDEVWKALLKKMDHPSEARSVTRAYDLQKDLSLI